MTTDRGIIAAFCACGWRMVESNHLSPVTKDLPNAFRPTESNCGAFFRR